MSEVFNDIAEQDRLIAAKRALEKKLVAVYSLVQDHLDTQDCTLSPEDSCVACDEYYMKAQDIQLELDDAKKALDTHNEKMWKRV